MSLVLTQEGAKFCLQKTLDIQGSQNLYCHLFGQAYAPLHTDTLSIFVAKELPPTGGYAVMQLANPSANWTFAPVSQGEQATYVPLSWTFTAALVVYGYWLSWDNAGVSWYAEEFGVYYQFPPSGGIFTLSLPPYLISTP
jgi:hypothetical protein